MKHSTLAATKRIPGIIALENGKCFTGISVGFEGLVSGEVVFNTSITGYQAILTDPAYAWQIVAMTPPQIGNTGVNPEDNESEIKPLIRGLLMRELSARVSNWRATESLPEFLQRNQIIALSEIDTRSLTQVLRTHGTQRGIIASGNWNTKELIQKAKDSIRIEDADLIDHCTLIEPAEWTNPTIKIESQVCSKTIVVYDFGVRRSTLQSLVSLGIKVIRVPARIAAKDVLDLQPDGVILSSGPGDPGRLKSVAEEVTKLLGKVPICGIGLGHQVLAKAFGGKTYRLPFGHHGGQPVLDKQTGKIDIVPQNHNFCVDPDSILQEVEITHTHLHDGSVEGLRHKTLPAFSVQFNPKEESAMFSKWISNQNECCKIGK